MDYKENQKYLVSGKDTKSDIHKDEEMIFIRCDDSVEERYLLFEKDDKLIYFFSGNIYKIGEIN